MADLEVVGLLDNCSIKPVSSVKLLGVTIDQHFTMGEHIDNVVRKRQGLLGVLRRAAPSLSRVLLRIAYVALIRSHLEYASAVLAPAAKTHMRKLDVIQKIASRIISGAPRDAHSEPLLRALGLESLESRRNDHVIKLINPIIAGSSHPIFNDYFTVTTSGDNYWRPDALQKSELARNDLELRALHCITRNVQLRPVMLRAQK
jgi:hypothetical protein